MAYQDIIAVVAARTDGLEKILRSLPYPIEDLHLVRVAVVISDSKGFEAVDLLVGRSCMFFVTGYHSVANLKGISC